MARVLYCYCDIKILITTNINLKHCPGLKLYLIPKLISWAGLKSNISDFVKYCSDYILAMTLKFFLDYLYNDQNADV